MANPDIATLRAGLNLARRLPPKDVKTHVSALTVLAPHLTDEWLQRIDTPLATAMDTTAGKTFLLCDYNRDGDSYRSPWSNTYFPPLSDGFCPSQEIRLLEEKAGEAWDAYREAYYGGGKAGKSLSSVYCWSLDESKSGKLQPFASCWLIKKEVEGGTWDSIHVVEVLPSPDGSTATYKLTSTIILSLTVKNEAMGVADLSGSLTRQSTATHPVTAERNHIVNMGTIIEAMESDMRASMDSLYMSKSREIVAACHSKSGEGKTRTLVSDLAAAMKARHT